MKHVQFKDTSNEVVIASFGCEQDPDVYPNLGVIQEDDPRYVAFLETMPKPAIGAAE